MNLEFTFKRTGDRDELAAVLDVDGRYFACLLDHPAGRPPYALVSGCLFYLVGKVAGSINSERARAFVALHKTAQFHDADEYQGRYTCRILLNGARQIRDRQPDWDALAAVLVQLAEKLCEHIEQGEQAQTLLQP